VSQAKRGIGACGGLPSDRKIAADAPLATKEIPMTTFDDRANAFENKFAHDQEMQFRAEARRNKLIGLWAADVLGKTGDDAQAYALEVIKSDFEEAGHEDVMRKLLADLGGRVPEADLRQKYDALLVEAKAQLMGEI